MSAIRPRQVLEQLGHEVVLIENCIEAWRRLQAERFALVIADWNMPDMGGLELARGIRNQGDLGVYIIERL